MSIVIQQTKKLYSTRDGLVFYNINGYLGAGLNSVSSGLFITSLKHTNLLQKGAMELRLFTDKYNPQTTRPSTSGLSLLPDTVP